MRQKIYQFFAEFPTMEMEEIRLREMNMNDCVGYFEMMSHPEGAKYLADEDVPKSLHDTTKEIEYWSGLFKRRESIFWTVADARTDQFMGTIGFNNWHFSNQRAEVSYDLCYKYWRRGIMSKAVNAVMAFAFDKMVLNRIEARTMIDNIPSQRMLEKLGFSFEGVQKGYRVTNGQSLDVMLYGLTKAEFMAE